MSVHIAPLSQEDGLEMESRSTRFSAASCALSGDIEYARRESRINRPRRRRADDDWQNDCEIPKLALLSMAI
jgi:hypothetical protein